jgi:hypothetical protein
VENMNKQKDMSNERIIEELEKLQDLMAYWMLYWGLEHDVGGGDPTYEDIKQAITDILGRKVAKEVV